MIVAITGGTGFVGSHLIDAAIAEGHDIRALTRRDQPARDQVEWVRGDLDDRSAIGRLVSGADAVIHVAGVINATTAADFEHGNVRGTLTMLSAATAAGARRFVHVSSLAAREPDLSLYGNSKAKSEDLVKESGLDWAIVRPPAVYGPGDRETLELFKMADLGLMLMPPQGRVSIIHVRDLAQLLLALTDDRAPKKLIFEPDDGQPAGRSHGDFMRAIGRAMGTAPKVVPLPGPLLRAAARVDMLVRRDRAKLTPDRVAYFLHRDWVVDPSRRPPASLWQPAISADRGLAETADWYRDQNWL